jgi:hypothetical protein
MLESSNGDNDMRDEKSPLETRLVRKARETYCFSAAGVHRSSRARAHARTHAHTQRTGRLTSIDNDSGGNSQSFTKFSARVRLRVQRSPR